VVQKTPFEMTSMGLEAETDANVATALRGNSRTATLRRSRIEEQPSDAFVDRMEEVDESP
jgi:hypothetical protein